MSDISVFEVLGPNMIGPSSSHTAGAARIAYLARKLMEKPPVRVDFILYGSFARTYKGHGTDKALLGGIMGFDTDDMRIRDSFSIADRQGLEYHFLPDHENTDVHPNTVDIRMVGASGRQLTVRGESLGGGKVNIAAINGVRVDLSGEYSTLVVIHKDKMGVLAHITKCVCDENLNIAFLRLCRDGRGYTAYTILESDDRIPERISAAIKQNENVKEVMIVQL